MFVESDVISSAERCQSGRLGRSRKPLCLHGYRGFESHPLRHQRRCVHTACGSGETAAPAWACERQISKLIEQRWVGAVRAIQPTSRSGLSGSIAPEHHSPLGAHVNVCNGADLDCFVLIRTRVNLPSAGEPLINKASSSRQRCLYHMAARFGGEICEPLPSGGAKSTLDLPGGQF